MKSSIVLLLLSISNAIIAQDTFQLAPPLLKYGSVFFRDKAIVEISFAQSETEVHYTLNNLEPTINDRVYKNPIIIKNNFATLKAKAIGNNFHPSETVTATFIKEGKAIQSIQQTTPNSKYPGSGANTLTDNKGGIEQLSSNTWMGYNCDTVTVTMKLGKQQTVNKVLLNFLQSESGWVFLPNDIIINWFDKKTNSYQFFGEEKILSDKETSGSHCNYRIIGIKNKIQTDKILISIIVSKNIPAWHSAKGEHGWMFIDEIKVY
jgi:Fn3 associated